MEFDSLERTLIEALLTGSDPVLERLRAQFDAASVERREYTGCGLFTHMWVPSGLPEVEPPDFVIDDVHLDVDGTENGASAMLFVRSGRIDFLEVVATTGEWPKVPILKHIHYFTHSSSTGNVVYLKPSDTRDLTVTRSAWRG